MTLVLASTSPRRRDLLPRFGVPYSIEPSLVVEREPEPGEDPEAYAAALAREKAETVASRHPDEVILAADTVVAVDGHILGKPVDETDALRMLRLLRGRAHTVVTAVALVRAGQIVSGVSMVTVRMRDASDEELQAYIAGGEPMDKAGAYAIQGLGGQLVDEIAGCYNAVVGLPLGLTADLFKRCGIQLPAARCCSYCDRTS